MYLLLSFSLLRRLSQFGADDTSTLPPMRFGYHRFTTTGAVVQEISPAPGRSLAQPDTDLLDVDGDSLPDVIRTEPSLHAYYRNLGDNTFSASADPLLSSPPVSIETANAQFMDVNGDGLTWWNDATCDVWRVSYPPTLHGILPIPSGHQQGNTVGPINARFDWL